MEVKSRVGCQDARLRSGSERSPRRPSSCTIRTHTNVPIERITLAPTVARNLRKRSSAQQFPAVADKDGAGGSRPCRPLPALTSEMLVIVSGVSLDGGVPDQELLPGYRSWSWMCCSTSPHRPVEAPHRPVECHPRCENGPSGPSRPVWSASLGRPLLRRSPQGDRDRHGGGCAGRCAFGSAGRAVPGRPYRQGVRWARDALRLGRARRLGGLVGAWQPGQGR